MDERMNSEREAFEKWHHKNISTGTIDPSGVLFRAWKAGCAWQTCNWDDRAHLAQPAQAVDVGAILEVIAELTKRANAGFNTNDRARCGHWATQLTRAIGNAQAEGWRELEAEARRLYNASVGDAHNLHCLAWSELSKDQQRKWISKASTAPSTQATPNAHE